MENSITSNAGGKVCGLPPGAQNMLDLGFDCIPILPGAKLPLRRAWQTRPPAEQWESAPSDCNLALRHGGALRLASVEAERDHPEAIPMLRRHLAGLGYDWQSYPATRTAHAGERYSFAFLDAPATGSSRKMHADFGGGELRFGAGAQALIAPSTLADGGRYEDIAGAWDGELPKLAWADIAPLLADGRRRDEPTPELSPTPLSAFALALEATEAEIANLPRTVHPLLKGENARTNYPGTDEQRILAILANAGKSFDAALLLFQRHPCFGHFSKAYAKNPSKAIDDLRRSYDAARQWALTPSETVQRLAAAIADLEAKPLPGRTGSTDTAVLLSHLRIAHDAGVHVYAAAVRRLAELAGVHRNTAERACSRLMDANLIAVHRGATPERATEYSLTARVVVTLPSVLREEVSQLRAQIAPADAKTDAGKVQELLSHDVFRWAGLGKSAGLVFAALLAGPGTVAELAERSARHPVTVKRALSKLAEVRNQVTGELFSLVEETEPGTWEVAAGANLDDAARLLGVAGKGDAQRLKHAQERQAHESAFAVYLKDGAPIPRPSQNRGERMTPDEVDRKARQKTHTERVGTPEADEFRLQAEAMS